MESYSGFFHAIDCHWFHMGAVQELTSAVHDLPPLILCFFRVTGYYCNLRKYATRVMKHYSLIQREFVRFFAFCGWSLVSFKSLKNTIFLFLTLLRWIGSLEKCVETKGDLLVSPVLRCSFYSPVFIFHQLHVNSLAETCHAITSCGCLFVTIYWPDGAIEGGMVFRGLGTGCLKPAGHDHSVNCEDLNSVLELCLGNREGIFLFL